MVCRMILILEAPTCDAKKWMLMYKHCPTVRGYCADLSTQRYTADKGCSPWPSSGASVEKLESQSWPISITGHDHRISIRRTGAHMGWATDAES